MKIFNNFGSLFNAVPVPNFHGRYLFLILFLWFSFTNKGFGQINTYSFTQTTGTYTEISGGTLLATATSNLGATSLDDVVYNVAGLPFSFAFNGLPYTSFNVSTNGFITFGTTAPATTNYSPISGTETYAGCISAWGRDLCGMFNVGTRTSTLRWQVIGTAPNREVVIQFKNWRIAYSTSTTIAPYFDFQIRLKETSNVIDIVYGPSGMAVGTSTSTISYTAEVGLRGVNNTYSPNVLNRTNTTAVSVNSSSNGTLSASSQATTLGSFSSNGTPGRHTNGKIYRYTPPVPPACAMPSALTTSSITTTTATISWTAASPAPSTGYQYYVSTSATAPTAGTTPTGSTAAGVVTANLTGLTANTTYYFWVRSNCGGSGTSSWAGSGTFYTGYCLVSGTNATYYINNFTTTGGLTNINNSTGYSAGGYGSYTGVSMSTYIGQTISFTSTFTGGGTMGFRIYIDWNNDMDFLDANENPTYGSAAYVGSAAGTFTVPAGTPNGSYRMRIVADYLSTTPISCGASTYLEAEDYTITIVSAPSCLAPTALTTVSVTSTTATISWTAASPAPSSGYQYYVSTSATAPTAGTTPSGSTAAGVTTANITGLTANTTYYFWVRSNCGGTQSSWAGSSTIYTGYCIPSATIVDGTGITNVTFGLGPVVNNTTGAEANNYGNYSAQIGGLTQGVTATVSITFNTSIYDYNTVIWVDWNNDLDFLDAGEQVYTGLSSTVSPNTLTATFLVPGTATVGANYRMRIGAGDSGAPTSCATLLTYTCFEDYTIQVLTPPSCFAPTALTSSSVTTTTATISWTAASPAPSSGYQYYVSTSATAPTAGTTPTGSTAAGVTTANLTGLTSNVTYYFWVRGNCGGSGTSTWAGSSTFFTGNPACTNTSSFGTATAPTTNTTVTISTCNFQSEYSTVGGIVSGSTYVFNYLDAFSVANGYITVRTGTYNGTVVASGNAPLTWVANLTGTVYVHYNTNSSCATASSCGTSTVACSSCSSPISNDVVCSATSIACGGTASGTTVGANNTGTGENQTCGVAQTQPGVWYVVAGNGQVMTASLCATSAWDSKISVFSGTSCAILTCVGGNDDNGPACATGAASYSWTSVSGTNYYILVHGFSSSSAFTLGLTCTAAPPADPTSITAPQSYICTGSGNSVTLTANGAVGTVYWFTGSCGTTGQIGTGNSITVTPSATTTYYARNFSSGLFSNNCVSIDIELRTPPAVVAGANTAVCLGSSVQLSATASDSEPNTLTVSTPGTNGCTGGSMFDITPVSAVTLTSFDVVPDLTGTQTVNVYYKTGTYAGSETNSAAWTLLGSYPITGTADVMVNMPITSLSLAAGTTYGIYLNYNGAYTTGSTSVSDGIISVSAGVGLCGTFTSVNTPRTFNGRVNYNYNPNVSLSWSPSATLSANNILNPIATPTTTTNYTLTGSALGCSSTSSVQVAVNAIPTAAPTFAANPVCNGASTTLSANAAAGSGTISTYAWSSGISGNNASGSVSTAGTYTVTVTNSNGCTVTATSASLTLNANPTVAPSFAANPICNGASTTLSANAAAGSGTISTYAWSSGISGNNASGSVSTAGAYTVTVTNSNGCTVTGTSSALALNAVPTASPTFAANPICNGASTTLDANATAGSGTISTYAWSSGISGNNASGSVSTAGAYNVTVTNSNGCTATATSSALALNANPTAAPAFASNSICNGASTTLSANAAAGSGTISTYAWSSGISGNNASGSVSTAATYTVTVTNSNGCTVTANSSALTVNALPSAAPSFTSNPICSGASTTLNANGTAGSGSISTYAWSSGISGNNASGNISSTGTYTVTVTNSNGCTATATSSALSLNSLPSVSVSASSTTVCEGSNVTLSGSGATSYSWSGGITNGLAFAATTSITSYNVTGTDANGCTGTGSVNLVVNTVSSIPTVTSIPGRLCPNTNSTVSAGGGTAGTGAIINWYSGPNGTGTLLGTGASISLPFAASTTVYVRREGACNNTADVSTTIDIRAFMTISANSATTSNYCVDNDGWGHWYDSNDEIIFSAKGDFSMCPPGYPQAVVSKNSTNSFYNMSQNSTTLCANNQTPGEMRFEMGRSWNLDMGGATPSGLYSVRFYFLPSERSSVINAAADTMANTAYTSCGYSMKYNSSNNGWFWFKNVGTTYVAPQWEGTLYDGATGNTSNGVTYVEMDSIPSFSGGSGGVILVPNSTLPISWKTFNGETNNKVNFLRWITATEQNTEYFEVERSADGINFETIGLVAASGNSSSDKLYNFDDNNPIIGINYYRLRLVELDGTTEYSNVIALEVKGDKKPYIFYPNPVTEVLTYQFTAEQEGDVIVEVMDALGRVIKSENKNSLAGSNQFFIDMSNLVSGTYSIRVRHLQSAEMHSDIIIKK